MPDRLTITNQAFVLMGLRELRSLTEARAERQVIDAVWDWVVQTCLAQGMWSFAMRLRKLTKTDKGDFDFAYSFDRPADLLHLFKVSKDKTFQPTSLLVHDFADSGGKWYADVDTLYVLHTSNDTSYGANVTAWPYPFANYVAATLAAAVAFRLTRSGEVATYCEQMAQLRYANALSIYQVDGALGLLPKDAEAQNPARLAATHEPARFMKFQPMLPKGGGK